MVSARLGVAGQWVSGGMCVDVITTTIKLQNNSFTLGSSLCCLFIIISFPYTDGNCPSVLYLCACMLSHFSLIRLYATLWTVNRQASLSMGFSRQEY